MTNSSHYSSSSSKRTTCFADFHHISFNRNVFFDRLFSLSNQTQNQSDSQYGINKVNLWLKIIILGSRRKKKDMCIELHQKYSYKPTHSSIVGLVILT